MDNKTFISAIAKRLGTDTATVAKLTEGFALIVSEQCGQLNRVALPGFGAFEGVKQEESVTTDLSTGCRILLPPSIEVRFVPGGMLKKSVKEGIK